MTLIACPAESCRSRAMRMRSSAAARRRSRSASRSAFRARSSSSAIRSRRSRVRSPANQAAAHAGAEEDLGREALPHEVGHQEDDCAHGEKSPPRAYWPSSRSSATV